MKNRILLIADVLLFAGIAMTSCSKEKINEIVAQHSRESAKSSGSSSSDDNSSSSEYGHCSNSGNNSGSGSSHNGSGN